MSQVSTVFKGMTGISRIHLELLGLALREILTDNMPILHLLHRKTFSHQQTRKVKKDLTTRLSRIPIKMFQLEIMLLCSNSSLSILKIILHQVRGFKLQVEIQDEVAIILALIATITTLKDTQIIMHSIIQPSLRIHSQESSKKTDKHSRAFKTSNNKHLVV